MKWLNERVQLKRDYVPLESRLILQLLWQRWPLHPFYSYKGINATTALAPILREEKKARNRGHFLWTDRSQTLDRGRRGYSGRGLRGHCSGSALRDLFLQPKKYWGTRIKAACPLAIFVTRLGMFLLTVRAKRSGLRKMRIINSCM